jgi:hypothetical protein
MRCGGCFVPIGCSTLWRRPRSASWRPGRRWTTSPARSLSPPLDFRQECTSVASLFAFQIGRTRPSGVTGHNEKLNSPAMSRARRVRIHIGRGDDAATDQKYMAAFAAKHSLKSGAPKGGNCGQTMPLTPHVNLPMPFLIVGTDRMMSFSISTARKRRHAPPISQSQADQGRASVSKIAWNGGA